MQLLDKKTTSTLVATQKKNQIDEGVILAKKIDVLRKTYSELEAQHKKFIDASTVELTKRTQELNDEIGYKEKYIKELEERQAKLLEPLAIKWDEVEEAERELEQERKELLEKRKSLTSFEQELQEREKNLSLDEERNEDVKKQINKQVDKITETSLEVQNALLNVRQEETDTLLRLKEKEDSIVKKEVHVLSREKNVELREKILQKEEEEITNEKIRLADQRATLERAMKRLK